MQIFATPELRSDELEVLELIDGLRHELRHYVAEPRQWTGALRRTSFARAVQASNSIEGYNASIEDTAAIVEDEPALEASEATQHAIAGYRDALTYVLQIAGDGAFRVDEGLLRSLHFMMLRHELEKSPGNWRSGEVFVVRSDSGERVYSGPDAEVVPGLIASMLERLDADEAPPLVRGAMAHLNLAMIHPFRDGNGRMARCLQTLVLARESKVSPVFSSIEEFLGRNTAAYYDVLAEVGAGSWNPGHDARPWIRFCLRAHYIQAASLLRRNAELESLYVACEQLAAERGLPERVAAALLASAYGLRLRRAGYISTVTSASGEPLSELTASRDLQQIVKAGLLEAFGSGRGRYYLPGDRLKLLRAEARESRPARASDPFDLVRKRRQTAFDLELDG